jgi:large subunit ribosomal protein L22
MQSRCVARWIRISPRKMRLVADMVRGKTVNEAIGLLKFTPRSGARPTLKAIQSAVANIVNRDDARDVNPDALVVKTIFVDEGPTSKRFMPRAMGRATPILKRSSHLTVDVALPEVKAAVVAAEPVEEKKEKKATKVTKVTKEKKKVSAPKSAASKSAPKRSVKKKKTD